MRVLLASNFYPPHVVGGAELVVFYLAKFLVDVGHEVTVVSTCRAGMASDAMQEGVRVVRYFPPNLWWNFDRFDPNDRRTSIQKVIWNLRDGWNTKSAQIFDSILESFGPDIVHTHNIKGMSPSIWSAARARSVPVIHTAHDYHLICQSGSMTRASRECTNRCLRCTLHGSWYSHKIKSYVDLLCSPSFFLSSRHADFQITTRFPLEVVQNGVPGTPHVRTETQVQDELRLLFIGQLRAEKGANLLPAIMRHLSVKARLDVGGVGSLADMIARSNSKITMHGFVSTVEKNRLFDAATALLFPSMWSENAPLVIIEAFMRGLPVIASDKGAIPEFVRDGFNGLLVEPGNAGAFAQAAEKMLDPKFSNKLSKGASETAERFTLAMMAKRYLSLYERCLLERGGGENEDIVGCS